MTKLYNKTTSDMTFGRGRFKTTLEAAAQKGERGPVLEVAGGDQIALTVEYKRVQALIEAGAIESE